MMKAAARKSLNKFKAIIIYDLGNGRKRTEILGKKSRPLIWRGKEHLPGGPTHYVRGKVFDTKEEAINFAQKVIDKRILVRKNKENLN